MEDSKRILYIVSLGKGRVTIHKVWEPIRMRGAIELPNVHDIVLVFQYCRFIVVHIQIIRCRENSHNSRKLSGSSFAIHAISCEMLAHQNLNKIPCILSFMCSNYRKQIVTFKELTCGVVTVFDQTGQQRMDT